MGRRIYVVLSSCGLVSCLLGIGGLVADCNLLRRLKLYEDVNIKAAFCAILIGVVVAIVAMIFARMAHLSRAENRAAFRMAMLALLSPLAVPPLAIILVIIEFLTAHWR